jgi:hypothetical protein
MGRRNMDSEPASVGADAFSVSNGCLTACGTKKDPGPGSRHCFTTARYKHQPHNTILPALGILRLLYAPFFFYRAQCVEPCRIVRNFCSSFRQARRARPASQRAPLDKLLYSGHSSSQSFYGRLKCPTVSFEWPVSIAGVEQRFRTEF